MIVASFLIKDLHIDWRWGEEYFAEMLVDYDPAVNNGNWQWCASTGCDSQPYFRIFNPWLQQKRFDPDAAYCKRWVSELARATPEQIHAAHKKPISGYARPIVDHSVEAKKALAYYKACK
jgi:deoxyribodipyrimidine photo-lyase